MHVRAVLTHAHGAVVCVCVCVCVCVFVCVCVLRWGGARLTVRQALCVPPSC